MDRRQFLAGVAATGSLASLIGDRETFASAADSAADPAAALPANDLAAVKLLVFDTFGTVVDWRSAVIAEGQKIGRAKGLTVDWEAFADQWRGGYGPSMNKVRTGELPWTKLDVLHRMTLDTLLEKFKITGLSEAEKVDFNRIWHRLKGWPDSVAGLTRLRKRFVIAPLSNGNLSLLTNMGKFAGLPWDCILSTELVRHYKPDRETYLMPPAFFDLPPSGVMMVAAHIGDLQSAKELGLKTAYVHRPLEYGPGKATEPPAAGRFDYSASSMLDLATQLGL